MSESHRERCLLFIMGECLLVAFQNGFDLFGDSGLPCRSSGSRDTDGDSLFAGIPQCFHLFGNELGSKVARATCELGEFLCLVWHESIHIPTKGKATLD